MLRSPLWVSALVVAKVNRFELTVALVGAMIAAIAAVLTAGTFGAIQPPPDCLRAWVASVQVTPECQSAVEQWSALSEGITGKVMAAMAVVPAAAGLLFGVPVVAREIEAGTAPFVWAVAGSRTRWLVRQVVPLLAVLVLALGILSIAAGLLADARSGGNVWSSTFADAELFGPTLVARGLVAFTLGVFVGALVGRILPAVLVAAALAVGVTVVAASAQGMVVQSTYQLSDVGAPGSAVAFVRLRSWSPRGTRFVGTRKRRRPPLLDRKLGTSRGTYRRTSGRSSRASRMAISLRRLTGRFRQKGPIKVANGP